MFAKVTSMKERLSMDDKKAALITALLPALYLRNPFELRGRRRVKLILEFIKVSSFENKK